MSWENNVRKVVPYTPGEQPKLDDITKLNTNENPYPPAPGVQEILNSFDIALMRKYPDPNAQILVDAIAKTYGVKPSQVFVGVGSDDVISMAFMTFFNGQKPILFPDVTYSFYDVWADVYRIPYEQIPLDEDFRINAKDYARENGGIIFPNPNAPTGVLESLDTIEEIIALLKDAFRICGIEPKMRELASTDANIPLSLGIPAATITSGGDSGGTHDISEWYDPTDAYKGVQKNLVCILSLTGVEGVIPPQISKTQTV